MKFPDQEYLRWLLDDIVRRNGERSVRDRLIAESGAALNWVGDYISDESLTWKKRTLDLDALWLTGTFPEWNPIIIDQCQRSPVEFRRFLSAKPDMKKLFDRAKLSDQPILVRPEEEKLKVLDGMYTVIAAIVAGHKTIEAFVCTPAGKPRPHCEPHVVYDLIRAYDRKINPDRAGLIAALRFLKNSYANVEPLLRERFSGDWMPNQEIREIIAEVLKG